MAGRGRSHGAGYLTRRSLSPALIRSSSLQPRPRHAEHRAVQRQLPPRPVPAGGGPPRAGAGQGGHQEVQQPGDQVCVRVGRGGHRRQPWAARAGTGALAAAAQGPFPNRRLARAERGEAGRRPARRYLRWRPTGVRGARRSHLCGRAAALLRWAQAEGSCRWGSRLVYLYPSPGAGAAAGVRSGQACPAQSSSACSRLALPPAAGRSGLACGTARELSRLARADAARERCCRLLSRWKASSCGVRMAPATHSLSATWGPSRSSQMII